MRSSGFCMHSSQRFSLEPDLELVLLAAPEAPPDSAPPAEAPPAVAPAPEVEDPPTGLPSGPETEKGKMDLYAVY